MNVLHSTFHDLWKSFVDCNHNVLHWFMCCTHTHTLTYTLFILYTMFNNHYPWKMKSSQVNLHQKPQSSWVFFGLLEFIPTEWDIKLLQCARFSLCSYHIYLVGVSIAKCFPLLSDDVIVKRKEKIKKNENAKVVQNEMRWVDDFYRYILACSTDIISELFILI